MTSATTRNTAADTGPSGCGVSWAGDREQPLLGTSIVGSSLLMALCRGSPATLFYIRGNEGPERAKDLPKVIQQAGGRAGASRGHLLRPLQTARGWAVCVCERRGMSGGCWSSCALGGPLQGRLCSGHSRGTCPACPDPPQAQVQGQILRGREETLAPLQPARLPCWPPLLPPRPVQPLRCHAVQGPAAHVGACGQRW